MKRLLSFFMVLIAVNTFGQTTITDIDMPVVNDTFRITTALDTAGIDPSLTGANYPWTYLDFVPTAQRIDTFFSVTVAPLAYRFYFDNGILYPDHKASYALRGEDIGIPQVPITDVFNFIKKSSTAYDNVGFGSNISGVPSSTRNIPVDREYVFPMNYLDIHTSFADYVISVPGFGAYGQELTRNDTVDGWGSLTTPLGTYNCLRVKSTIDRVDTTYIDAFSIGTKIPRPEEIEYKWLAQGMGVPVLKIVTTAGVISLIEYQDINRPGVGVEEHVRDELFKIYPNPSNDMVNVVVNEISTEALYLSIMDLNGKLLFDQKYMWFGKDQIIQLKSNDIGLTKGIYLIEVRLGNEHIGTKKWVVN